MIYPRGLLALFLVLAMAGAAWADTWTCPICRKSWDFDPRDTAYKASWTAQHLASHQQGGGSAATGSPMDVFNQIMAAVAAYQEKTPEQKAYEAWQKSSKEDEKGHKAAQRGAWDEAVGHFEKAEKHSERAANLNPAEPVHASNLKIVRRALAWARQQRAAAQNQAEYNRRQEQADRAQQDRQRREQEARQKAQLEQEKQEREKRTRAEADAETHRRNMARTGQGVQAAMDRLATGLAARELVAADEHGQRTRSGGPERVKEESNQTFDTYGGDHGPLPRQKAEAIPYREVEPGLYRMTIDSQEWNKTRYRPGDPTRRTGSQGPLVNPLAPRREPTRDQPPPEKP